MNQMLPAIDGKEERLDAILAELKAIRALMEIPPMIASNWPQEPVQTVTTGGFVPQFVPPSQTTGGIPDSSYSPAPSLRSRRK